MFERYCSFIPQLRLLTLLFCLAWCESHTFGQPQSIKKSKGDQATKQEDKAPPKFDGEYAYQILGDVCKLGARVSTSEAMKKQQELIKAHFDNLGAKVIEQNFQARHPLDGQIVTLKNMIVRFHPERKRRLLFACHYDTRPFPDRDPKNPTGVFLGANDGASGVGLFFELGKHISMMEGNYGIDLVFFDGEEFVWRSGVDPMFLGSNFFATEYSKNRWDVKYYYGILVDMIADKELELYYEANSLQMAPKLTKSIWGVAAEMGVKEFVQKERHTIRDDHLPLNTIARIQTCDIIDFDYPNVNASNAYWHTEQDLPENCSAESLEKVGRVLVEWLRQMQKLK
ncbi:MAG: M28 family peptidase [Pirellulaceae bacterium]